MGRNSRVDKVRKDRSYRRKGSTRRVIKVDRHTVTYLVEEANAKGPGAVGQKRTVARATWSIWMKEAKLLDE